MTLSLTLWATLALAAPEMIPLDAVEVVGHAAPAVTGKLLAGGDFDLEALRGKPVVLAFWASWCGPCREELPALTELAATRPDVRFYTVNVDRDVAAAKRFLANVRTDLPVVLDPDARAMGAYDVASMPTMFLLDRNLTVKWRKVGYGRTNGLSELVDALGGVK